MLFLWFKHLFNIFIAYIRFYQIKISYTHIITKKTFLKQKNPLPTGEGRLSKRYSNGIWIRIEIGSLRLAPFYGAEIYWESFVPVLTENRNEKCLINKRTIYDNT